jgi:hypothetical protein
MQKTGKLIKCGINLLLSLSGIACLSLPAWAKDYRIQATLVEQNKVIASEQQTVSSTNQNHPLVLDFDSYSIQSINGPYTFGTQLMLNIGQDKPTGKNKVGSDYLYMLVVQQHLSGTQSLSLPIVANDDDQANNLDDSQNQHTDTSTNSDNNDFYVILPKVSTNQTETLLIVMNGKPQADIKKVLILHDKDNFLHHVYLDVHVQQLNSTEK